MKSIHSFADRSKLALMVPLGIMFLAVAPIASADVPLLISYQARLTDVNGDALNGPFAVYFAIYDSPVSATKLWTEAYDTPRLNVQNGVVSVLLGSKTPFPPDLFTKNPLYLGVRIENDDELQPRRRIVSSAFAINALLFDGKPTSAFEPTGAIQDHNYNSSAHPNLIVEANRITGVLADGQIPSTITRDTELQAHTQDLDNPHQVTLPQAAGETSHTLLKDIGTYTHPEIDAHVNSRNNPHAVRRDQMVCPDGLVDATTFCIEVGKREATSWYVAAQVCWEANLRLCTLTEWYTACSVAGDLGLEDMNTDWEWLDNWTTVYEGAKNYYRPIVVGYPSCDQVTSFTASALRQYRCCQ